MGLPDNPVFADSRWEVIPDRAWDAYGSISAGRADWEELLAGYDIEVVALSREYQSALLPLIRRSDEWRLVYEDGEGAVFARSSTG